MRNIAVMEEFEVNDLSEDIQVNQLIEQIGNITDSEIRLDLKTCMLDYYATGTLVEELISKMSKIKGQKQLFIEVDYIVGMRIVLNWLFLGSKMMNLTEKNELSIDYILNKVEPVVKSLNIEIRVSIINKDGSKKEEVVIPRD